MADQTPFADNLKATPILDCENTVIRTIAADLRRGHADNLALLQAAHRYLVRRVQPIYTLDELQPASVTITKQSGSCSQRMAGLEAIARASEIPSRARALRISGSFWYPRFRPFVVFLPRDVLLVWPQFFVNSAWLDVAEIYAPVKRLAETARQEFLNDGESIFDAVDHVPIDFFAKTCTSECTTSKFDLSRFVLRDEGLFATRDEVFARFELLQRTFRGRIFEVIFGGRKSV